MESSLLRILRRLIIAFRYRLPLLPNQARQDLTEWKLLFDGLDNVLQLLFAASKGAFSVGHRQGEIERFKADRVPREALFQKPKFVSGQNKIEVANPFSHTVVSQYEIRRIARPRAVSAAKV